MTAGTGPGPLLAAALAAAGRGWPVFPLQPYGKRPVVRDWPHRATCDPEQLTGWWARSAFNVGIACGSAGLLVVDLDPGAELQLPATYIVATPRGHHHYFTVPAELGDAGDGDYRRRVRRSGRTTAGALGPQIDTRAAGGYVVAAGSVRLIAGRPMAYRVISPPEVAPVAAPGWLLEALVPPLPVGTAGDRLVRPGAYARAAVDREVAGVRGAGPGTRNSRLFGAAVRLGQLAAAGLLTEADVTAVLLRASDRHVGVDGFTAAEAARAVANGLAYGRRRPRRVHPVWSVGSAG